MVAATAAATSKPAFLALRDNCLPDASAIPFHNDDEL